MATNSRDLALAGLCALHRAEPVDQGEAVRLGQHLEHRLRCRVGGDRARPGRRAPRTRTARRRPPATAVGLRRFRRPARPGSMRPSPPAGPRSRRCAATTCCAAARGVKRIDDVSLSRLRRCPSIQPTQRASSTACCQVSVVTVPPFFVRASQTPGRRLVVLQQPGAELRQIGDDQLLQFCCTHRQRAISFGAVAVTSSRKRRTSSARWASASADHPLWSSSR